MNEDNLYSLKQQNTILVQMARNGDRQALTELFEQLHQPLLNYLYHMLGDRQQAEDLGQDGNGWN